jgi:transposase, IS30 family
MSPYKRLTRDDRLKIASMRLFNPHQYRIAEQIGCTQSAISQEISRNSVDGVYNFQKAEDLTKSRKKERKKTVFGNPKILNFIKQELQKRRSPEQISKLAEKEGLQVKKSSIYNYINKNPELKKYRKHKKYRKRSPYQASKHGIPDRVSIKERPEAANKRAEFGHFEIDFVISSGSPVVILSARERLTRYPFFIRLENKTELLTTEAIKNNLILSWTKSFSTDNDKSFVGHSVIKSMTGVPTYFTAPAAPYEKGAIEQLNKELRVYYPKGTNFSNVTQAELDKVAENLRTAPMKCLNWMTPKEALEKEFQLNTS